MSAKSLRNYHVRIGEQPDRESRCAVQSVFLDGVPTLDEVFPKMTPVILRMTTVSHCKLLD
jgi:hypothetical protein